MATQFDLDLMEAHNQARLYPRSLIPLIEERIDSFDSMSNPNIYKHKSNGLEVLTHEGPDALYELIDYIEDNFPE